MALGPAGDIGTVAALQHQPLDAGLARPRPQFFKLGHGGKVEQRRDVGARRLGLLVPSFEPRAALGEGQGAEIVLALIEHVVEADMGRVGFQHGGRHALAVQPLLQIVERRHLPPAHHQQLAVEHDAMRQARHHIGEGA